MRLDSFLAYDEYNVERIRHRAQNAEWMLIIDALELLRVGLGRLLRQRLPLRQGTSTGYSGEHVLHKYFSRNGGCAMFLLNTHTLSLPLPLPLSLSVSPSHPCSNKNHSRKQNIKQVGVKKQREEVMQYVSMN